MIFSIIVICSVLAVIIFFIFAIIKLYKLEIAHCFRGEEGHQVPIAYLYEQYPVKYYSEKNDAPDKSQGIKFNSFMFSQPTRCAPTGSVRLGQGRKITEEQLDKLRSSMSRRCK